MGVKLKCHCGSVYTAREADIKRGWGKTCSKSCASLKRIYTLPNATTPDGGKVNFGKEYKRPNDKRYGERARVRDEIAKREGYYPFDSVDEIYAAICPDPFEGR